MKRTRRDRLHVVRPDLLPLGGDSDEGNVEETEEIRVNEAPEAPSAGTNVELSITTMRAQASLSRRVTTPGYRVLPDESLTIGLRKG